MRKITTLHDLSLEIAQNEGVQSFEDLGLGPISLLPLVGQYFAPAGGPEVHKITTEDVLNYLAEYTNKCNGKVDVEAFLSFISNSRSIPSPQHLCVRMQNFGYVICIDAFTLNVVIWICRDANLCLSSEGNGVQH
mgnify:FL=1